MNRRQFLLGGMLSAAGMTYSTSYETTNQLEVQRFQLKFDDLNLFFKNLKIGFVSDIHAGPLLDYKLLDNAINILNDERLDLLLLGGDYIGLSSLFGRNSNIDIYSASFINQVIKELCIKLRNIPTKYGTFGVLGNHDNWHAREIIIKNFNDSEITLLNNQSHVIEDCLQLVGVDDYWTGSPKIPESLRPIFSILLAHNPDYFHYLITEEQFDFNLALAGHTHGGQICLPLIGPIAKNIEHQEFFIGLKKLNKKYVLTSAGLGVAMVPYRINCKPEIQILSFV